MVSSQQMKPEPQREEEDRIPVEMCSQKKANISKWAGYRERPFRLNNQVTVVIWIVFGMLLMAALAVCQCSSSDSDLREFLLFYFFFSQGGKGICWEILSVFLLLLCNFIQKSSFLPWPHSGLPGEVLQTGIVIPAWITAPANSLLTDQLCFSTALKYPHALFRAFGSLSKGICINRKKGVIRS